MLFTPSPLADLSKTYIVYRITAQNQVFYIGACTLTEFPLLQDARRNEYMRSLLCNSEFVELASIQIIAIHFDEAWATDHALGLGPKEKAVNHFVFRESVKKPKKGRVTRPIECIDTGEYYTSAAEACKTLEIKHSNLSNHLNTGKGTVGGMRFRYV